MSEAIDELREILKWLESGINSHQSCFDEPPEYASQEDYEMAQMCAALHCSIMAVETQIEGLKKANYEMQMRLHDFGEV